MTTNNVESEEHKEISAVLQQLRDKLKSWNKKYGHPFEGISDGFRTAIRSELMPACRAFADRNDLIAALPKGKRFAEVGNFFGQFSVKILELNQPREFHTFDWNLDLMNPEHRSVLDNYKTVFYYDGDPSISAEKIQPSTFDIVYLNKSRDYSGVRRDLDCWLERLTPDGYLVVNDFTAWDPVQGLPYGVLPAVSQFVNEQTLEVVFISLHPRGFLNIALRRI
jgi:hypothetical protein